MPIKSVIEAIRSAMYYEMKQDPNVYIIGQDVGKRGGVFLATENLMNEFGEKRVYRKIKDFTTYGQSFYRRLNISQ